MIERVIEREGRYLDAPDVCLVGSQVVVGAVAHEGLHSRIVVWDVTPDGAMSTRWTSSPLEGLLDVRLHGDGAGRVLALAWCMAAPSQSRVVVLEVGSDRVLELPGFSEPQVLGLETRAPAFVARAARKIVVSSLGPGGDGEVRDVSDGRARVFSPTAAPMGGSDLLVAWEQEMAPGCAILSRVVRADGTMGPILRLDDDEVTSHAPCASPTPAGDVVVAWHSPALFDEPQLLVKDLRLVRVASGEVLHPAGGHAPDPGPEPTGEEQGFEFPVPLAMRDGSIHVLGRGSHCYYRRVLDADGWGERETLDTFGWGCRGPRIRAVLAGGLIHCVTREKRGIALRILDDSGSVLPTGKPSFIPRSVRCTGGGSDPRPGAGRVRRDRDGLATWFGDIHQHSAFSDGTGAPRETYVRARDFYDDDLVCLTDHESFLGKQTPPGEWGYLQDLADRFDEPGRFCTLVGYEWTGKMHPGPGHKVVYYGEPGKPLVSRDDPGADSGAGLLGLIGEHGGIAVPHHVGWTGADESAHREDLQPCFEVISCHGAYETREDRLIGRREPDRGPFIHELLADGLRFGLTGGSDGHGLLHQHGISRKRDAHRTGLTAVVCSDLERSDVMRAIRARRVYATTGVRLWLRLWVDSVPMGGEVTCGLAPPRVEVQVDGYGPLTSVTLVTAVQEQNLEVAGDSLTWIGDLESHPAEARFVYLRVIRDDGECGWSSPVFFNPAR